MSAARELHHITFFDFCKGHRESLQAWPGKSYGGKSWELTSISSGSGLRLRIHGLWLDGCGGCENLTPERREMFMVFLKICVVVVVLGGVLILASIAGAVLIVAAINSALD